MHIEALIVHGFTKNGIVLEINGDEPTINDLRKL
jgi:hypothetical protein